MSTEIKNTRAESTEELQAFVRATRLNPGAVRDQVIDEIDKILDADPEQGEVRQFLASAKILSMVQERSAGSYADHVQFRQLLTEAKGEVAYLAYMRIWLGGELFFAYPHQFDKLPGNYRLHSLPWSL